MILVLQSLGIIKRRTFKLNILYTEFRIILNFSKILRFTSQTKCVALNDLYQPKYESFVDLQYHVSKNEIHRSLWIFFFFFLVGKFCSVQQPIYGISGDLWWICSMSRYQPYKYKVPTFTGRKWHVIQILKFKLNIYSALNYWFIDNSYFW